MGKFFDLFSKKKSNDEEPPKNSKEDLLNRQIDALYGIFSNYNFPSLQNMELRSFRNYFNRT